MKAAVYKKYGPPELVQVMEVAQPVPTENEVLIQVYASTVNRTDAGFRSAEYFVSRFWSGLFTPNYPILGSEFSGVVVDIGRRVKLFKPGDRVFGFNDETFGGHAEYMTIGENKALATIPENLDIYRSAAIAEGAHYALCNIRASRIRQGQKALVYGATGAIGSAAVQLLKQKGVWVTAVCNSSNVDLVKKLGADEVIDYQNQDFTKTATRYELIFDAVGKSSFKVCKPLLTGNGIYVSTELGKNGENVIFALLTPLFKSKKVIFPLPVSRKEDLLFLKILVENNEFQPVIDREYSLDQIVEAYRYVETGQKTGNVIVKIK